MSDYDDMVEEIKGYVAYSKNNTTVQTIQDTIEKDSVTAIVGGSIVTPKGFKVSGIYSGVKRKRNDLGAIFSEQPANAAAVYTLNKIQAAPLTVTKESIAEENKVQAVIVNSGNANACTGKKGLQDAYTMRSLIANHFNIPAHYAVVASTGIIGLDMPMDKITAHIEKLQVGNTKAHADDFGESIITTDTFSKSVCLETTIDGKKVVMGGAAKGSGMIEPNMGTMLAFITTDANIETVHLNSLLKEVINKTFNCITVDGDTSTNDMVLVMANGLAENNPLTPEHEDWGKFTELLTKTCESLAKQIAHDGEGATKLIEVEVQGAQSDEDAKKVAKSIVGSSLVKTAIYGADANWGRIIAAIGYSGAEVNPETIDTFIGPIQLLQNSEPTVYSEATASKYLENDFIKIDVHLNNGTGMGKAWGCDLTYDYVRINASYRS